MPFLFTLERSRARPTTETLLLSPFKEIWERDTTEDKTQAIKEFTFIEFMISKKKSNPFGEFEKEVRLEEVKKSIFKDEEWSPDALVLAGMEKLHDIQTNGSQSYQYLLAAESVLEKLKLFFLSFDLNERTNSGGVVYKPKEITAALNDINENLRNLYLTRQMVEQELYEATRSRTNKEINPYEV